MKKVFLLFVFTMIGSMTFGQAFSGTNWIRWDLEPDYANTPYENATYTVLQALEGWEPVSDLASFNETWDLIGEPELANKGVNFPDLIAFEQGNYGVEWKAVHDGAIMFVLLKFYDTNGLGRDHLFEIMAQPTSHIRHEPSFLAAADSVAANIDHTEDRVVEYQKMAYARFVELGGGKAMFQNGIVTAYDATAGLNRTWQGGRGYWSSPGFASNVPGLEAFIALEDGNLLFWEEADGVIHAVLPMDFAGVLSYPTVYTEPGGARTSLEIGDVIAFDIKSVSTITVTEEDEGGNPVERDRGVGYWWSATANNGFGSNYYSGHLTISDEYITDPNTSSIIRDNRGISEPRVYVSNGMLLVRGSMPVNLDVYNIVGSKVKRAQNVHELSLNDLENGIYIIRIDGDPKAVKVMKF